MSVKDLLYVPLLEFKKKLYLLSLENIYTNDWNC